MLALLIFPYSFMAFVLEINGAILHVQCSVYHESILIEVRSTIVLSVSISECTFGLKS